eukprot:388578_1
MNRCNHRTQFEPQSSLSDIHEMYQHLRDKIKSTNDITDLLPFVKSLVNIDELKSMLISSLNKYKSKSSLVMKRAVIQMYAFNGIPSDIVHANIISYLPSAEYAKLPVISRHFHEIMLNHPFIYNHKGYKVTLTKNNTNTIKFDHSKFSQEIKLPIRISPSEINSKIPVYSIKHWDISASNHCESSILHHLSKVSENMHMLTMTDNESNAKLIQKIEADCTFKKCYILSIFANNKPLKKEKFILCYRRSAGMNIFTNVKNKQYFSKLECLKLEIDLHGTFGETFNNSKFFRDLNGMLDYLSPTLQYLEFAMQVSSNSEDKFVVKIPKNIEWIRLTLYDSFEVTFDLSECVKLIGIRFENAETQFIWADDYIVPFAYQSPQNMEKVRFISPNYSYKKPIEIEDIMGKLQQNIQYDTGNSLLRLPLNVNHKNIFKRLIKYIFVDERTRNKKVQQYKRWWMQKTGLWMLTLSERSR